MASSFERRDEPAPLDAYEKLLREHYPLPECGDTVCDNPDLVTAYANAIDHNNVPELEIGASLLLHTNMTRKTILF